MFNFAQLLLQRRDTWKNYAYWTVFGNLSGYTHVLLRIALMCKSHNIYVCTSARVCSVTRRTPEDTIPAGACTFDLIEYSVELDIKCFPYIRYEFLKI